MADYRALVAEIPLAVVKELVLWGDGARLADRLAAYADAGMERTVVWNATGMGAPTGMRSAPRSEPSRRPRSRLQG